MPFGEAFPRFDLDIPMPKGTAIPLRGASTMPGFQFRRGEPVEDIVTGFKGYVTGRADYLTGCNTYLVTPPVDKDGKGVDSHWYDENRLRIDPSKTRLVLEQIQAGEPPG
jgi:hypothetical protein